MITVIGTDKGVMSERTLNTGDPLPENSLWVDLLYPDEAERQYVALAYDLTLPDQNDIQQIELSSRLYHKNQAMYLTLDVMVGFETPDPVMDSLLIVVTPSRLVTVRYAEPRAIEMFKNRIHQQPDLLTTAEGGLLALLDTISDRIADILEAMGRTVDDLSRQTFPRLRNPKIQIPRTSPSPRDKSLEVQRRDRQLNVILYHIGRAGDTTHKIGACINGMGRLMTFLAPYAKTHFNAEQITKFRAIECDIHSLNDHAQFVAHETSFLLDATLGQINIEQNNIIKIFSVVMVVFTPPTFFASMWGMNFHDMPEYGWPWGYAMAIGVMLISAIIPTIYFARRGWIF